MFHKNKHNFGLIRGQIREKKNYQGFPVHYFNVPHLLSVLSHWLSLHNKMNQAKEGGGCYCQEEGAAEHWAPCDLPLCWPGPQRGRALPQNSWWVPIGQRINWPSCLLISLSRVWSQGLDSPELGSHSELCRRSLTTSKTRTRPRIQGSQRGVLWSSS